MASQKLAADLDFLTDAAHLVRQTAPETSAHLMRQRAELMHHSGLVRHETQGQHVCGACGHIMIPGQGTELRLDGRVRPPSERRRRGRKRSTAKAPLLNGGPTKSFACGLCRRSTRIRLPAPAAVQRRKRRPQARAAAGDEKKKAAGPGLRDDKSTAKTANTAETANASSRKRTKNRKGGLQALLAGQQHKASSSLSLADFMA
ncbi:hypothetical protein E4U42_007513 [Claviceps africana]|uniref:Uncharacterized protein n=1 Tax=Claviceps africana TaxID=83212 RepID=A0A8K0J114_9HYPO|nr:hypothetical protein E4U42_007513 [Claviceps africana]